MATNPISAVLERVRRAGPVREGPDPTDGQLLGAFVAHRDEAAFAALVKRHGPMVWGVCRRLLDRPDAEDAFQATFLVLVRKAATVVPREVVGNWLYGVAHRTALHARRTVTRRRGRERPVTAMPDRAVTDPERWGEVRPLLDEELSRLPDRYRAVLVLSDLEGKTRKEVARQLGVPEGTVAGRLARGRALLAKRLTRRGVALSGGALAALLGANAAAAEVPTTIVSATILYAAGPAAIPTKVAILAEGVLKTMLFTKLRVVLVLLAMTVLASGIAFSCQPLQPQAADAPQAAQAKKDAKADMARLQGKWQIVSFAFTGRELQGDEAKRILAQPVVISGNKIKFRLESTYALDPSKNPKEFDLIVKEEAPEQERGTWKGIYKLTDDELTLCLAAPLNQTRPKEFFSKAEDTDPAKEVQLLKLKRIKPGSPAVSPPRPAAPAGPEIKLREAAVSHARIETVVGANVQVSRSRAGQRHEECVIAADPKDPKRLFASAMLWRKGNDASLVGYYSHDGGATWHVGFEADPSAAGERYCDETLEYAVDGTLYLAYLRLQLDEKGITGKLGEKDTGVASVALEFRSSPDGGKTWQRRATRSYLDRPWLAADRTGGPRSGRLYWCGLSGAADQPQSSLGASADGARTLEPASAAKPAVRPSSPRPTQPVVLSDGAVVFAELYNPNRGSGPPAFDVFRSDDGGKTLRRVGQLPTGWTHPRLRPNAHACGSVFPQLAVAGGGKHRDRLYCVWIDGASGGAQERVLLSRSDDRGETWTAPQVLSEQSMEKPDRDYSVAMATVAVNRDGVVAMCWYDCRNFPTKLVQGRYATAGYDVRLRVSLDGGDTWEPSVKVNEKSATADVHAYGHTAGLAITADGRFWPAWIDDRNGTPQLWCAGCTVRAAGR
jgi:RNA polymerase sigma factor (sigma-70 family)